MQVCLGHSYQTRLYCGRINHDKTTPPVSRMPVLNYLITIDEDEHKLIVPKEFVGNCLQITDKAGSIVFSTILLTTECNFPMELSGKYIVTIIANDNSYYAYATL